MNGLECSQMATSVTVADDYASADSARCPLGGERRPQSCRPPPTCSPSVGQPTRRFATSPLDPKVNHGLVFVLRRKDQLVGGRARSWAEAIELLHSRRPLTSSNGLSTDMGRLAGTAGRISRGPAAAAISQCCRSCSTRYGLATTATWARLAVAARPYAAIRLAALCAHAALGDRYRRADR